MTTRATPISTKSSLKTANLKKTTVYTEYVKHLGEMSANTILTSDSFDNGKGVLVRFPTYVNIDNALSKLDYSNPISFYQEYFDLMSLKCLLDTPEYIQKMPTFENNKIQESVKKINKKKIPNNKSSKQSTQRPTKTVSPAQTDKIKASVIGKMLETFPFSQFPFKTLQECNSKSTSSKFYVSKADIIKTIDNDAHLKNIFPKKYKTLNKSELCDVLFKDGE